MLTELQPSVLQCSFPNRATTACTAMSPLAGDRGQIIWPFSPFPPSLLVGQIFHPVCIICLFVVEIGEVLPYKFSFLFEHLFVKAQLGGTWIHQWLGNQSYGRNYRGLLGTTPLHYCTTLYCTTALHYCTTLSTVELISQVHSYLDGWSVELAAHSLGHHTLQCTGPGWRFGDYSLLLKRRRTIIGKKLTCPLCAI